MRLDPGLRRGYERAMRLLPSWKKAVMARQEEQTQHERTARVREELAELPHDLGGSTNDEAAPAAGAADSSA